MHYCKYHIYIFSESLVENILPLAHEYDVKSVLRECESFLLTEFEFKKGKLPSHYVSVANDVEFLIKCLYFGAEYGLDEIYGKAIESMIPYRLSRYKNNEYYKLLPEKNKRELLQNRLSSIEKEDNSFIDYSRNLFL
jgi:hypothetical protein